MPLSIKWSRTLATTAEQNQGWPALPRSLHENKIVREETIYMFSFQIKHCWEQFVSGRWNCHRNLGMYKKIPMDCQKPQKSHPKLQHLVYRFCWRHQSISQVKCFYLDLPYVASIYLLLVIEFRAFCMVFLKIGVFMSFLHMTDISALALMPIL